MTWFERFESSHPNLLRKPTISETQGKSRRSRVQFETEKRQVDQIRDSASEYRMYTKNTTLSGQGCLPISRRLSEDLTSVSLEDWTEMKRAESWLAPLQEVPAAYGRPDLTAQCLHDLVPIHPPSLIFPNPPKHSFKATSFRKPSWAMFLPPYSHCLRHLSLLTSYDSYLISISSFLASSHIQPFSKFSHAGSDVRTRSWDRTMEVSSADFRQGLMENGR